MNFPVFCYVYKSFEMGVEFVDPFSVVLKNKGFSLDLVDPLSLTIHILLLGAGEFLDLYAGELLDVYLKI